MRCMLQSDCSNRLAALPARSLLRSVLRPSHELSAMSDENHFQHSSDLVICVVTYSAVPVLNPCFVGLVFWRSRTVQRVAAFVAYVCCRCGSKLIHSINLVHSFIHSFLVPFIFTHCNSFAAKVDAHDFLGVRTCLNNYQQTFLCLLPFLRRQSLGSGQIDWFCSN